MLSDHCHHTTDKLSQGEAQNGKLPNVWEGRWKDTKTEQKTCEFELKMFLFFVKPEGNEVKEGQGHSSGYPF